ncbi:MAG TPA: hypothetical protein VF678_06150, partial [bacterium]
TKPKLGGVVRDYHASRSGPRKFGSDALKLNGKLFAMFRHSTLVVKLSKERTDALVAAKVGKYFEPGTGRVMKQWLTVTNPKADWLAIVMEAHAYAESGE